MTTKLIGIGNIGCEVAQRVYVSDQNEIETIAIDSDAFTLEKVSTHRKLHIGQNAQGMRGDPLEAYKAAEASKDEFVNLISGAGRIILTCGLGGGTGSGGILVASHVTRMMNVDAVAFVSRPVGLTANHTVSIARNTYKALQDHVKVTVVPGWDILSMHQFDAQQHSGAPLETGMLIRWLSKLILSQFGKF